MDPNGIRRMDPDPNGTSESKTSTEKMLADL